MPLKSVPRSDKESRACRTIIDMLQVRMIDARTEIEAVVQNLVDEHIDKSNSAEASVKPSESPGIQLSASGAVSGKYAQPASLRRGVAPGSFVDLLVTNGNRETGETFSSDCITQQVEHFCVVIQPGWSSPL